MIMEKVYLVTDYIVNPNQGGQYDIETVPLFAKLVRSDDSREECFIKETFNYHLKKQYIHHCTIMKLDSTLYCFVGIASCVNENYDPIAQAHAVKSQVEYKHIRL